MMMELERINHRTFNLLWNGEYLCQLDRDMVKWLKEKLEEALLTQKQSRGVNDGKQNKKAK